MFFGAALLLSIAVFYLTAAAEGRILKETVSDWSAGVGRATWFSFASVLERGGYNHALLPPRAMAIRKNLFLTFHFTTNISFLPYPMEVWLGCYQQSWD